MHCDHKMHMQENLILYVMKSNVMICKLTRWLVLNCLLPPTPLPRHPHPVAMEICPLATGKVTLEAL